MTCIAGIARGGKVWMAGDSATSMDDDMFVVRDPKVVKRGGMLLGCAGEVRLLNLVHHVLEIPQRKTRMTDMHYLTGPFADALARCVRAKAPHIDNSADKEDGMEFAMLIGYRGALYSMDSNYDIIRSVDDFDAIGSGGQVARGALYMAGTLAPRTALLRALSAAERYKASVRRPFRVVSV